MSISTHLNCVATLPRELQMYEKLTIIGNKRFGKRNRHFSPISQHINRARRYVRHASLWISGVLCVCASLSWHGSTRLQFIHSDPISSVHVPQSAAITPLVGASFSQISFSKGCRRVAVRPSISRFSPKITSYPP